MKLMKALKIVQWNWAKNDCHKVSLGTSKIFNAKIQNKSTEDVG